MTFAPWYGTIVKRETLLWQNVAYDKLEYIVFSARDKELIDRKGERGVDYAMYGVWRNRRKRIYNRRYRFRELPCNYP